MDVTAAMVLLVAGLAGGTINGIVGSGTLIVYPALLAIGLPPVVANGTNTTGLCFGSASSAWGYRRELAGRMRRLAPAVAATVVAATVGASLVIALPERVFVAVVPWLILFAALLVAIQPRVIRWLKSRRDSHEASPGRLAAITSVVGIYGGYFGASQGVIYMSILGVFYDHDLQKSNGAKNLLAATANITAAVVFIAAGRVNWPAAIMVALGAIVGGLVGARVGRMLPTSAFRLIIVVVGIVGAVYVLVSQ